MKLRRYGAALMTLLLLLSIVLLSSCGNSKPDSTEPQTNSDAPSSSSGSDGDADSTDDPDREAGSPDGSYTPSREVRTEDDGNILVLVNKEYPVSEDYEPSDMVEIDGSLSTNQNLKVKREAYEAYLEMLKDAQAEGLNFSICSAYRSYALQESLYNNSLAANGKEYTETMFAYPGKSEHHTGYAIDITSASMNWGLSQDFTEYPDGAWITEHCSEYGFIIRYPKGKEDVTGYVYEPWHIRYVGIDTAKYITDHELTLEEYLGVA